MLVVLVPATDPWLLSLDEARAAAGVDPNDYTQDAALEMLRATVSAQIYDALNIAPAGGSPPTLRRETLREIRVAPMGSSIVLKRRHNVEITALDGWPGIVSDQDYFLDEESGILHRAFEYPCMPRGLARMTIDYDAGFDEVPSILTAAASEMIRLRRSESTRDPLVKREVVDVDGIDRIEQEFWVTAAGSTAATEPVPPNVMVMLKRFRNTVHA